MDTKIMKNNRENIFQAFFHSLQRKMNKTNAMREEFISDIQQQRENLAEAVIALQKAKIIKDFKKIELKEIEVCSINKKIIKDCEVFQAIFGYHPFKD